MKIATPKLFNYQLSLAYLNRSPNEILHSVKDDCVYKAIKVEDKTLAFQIGFENNSIVCKSMGQKFSLIEEVFVKRYVEEWFDLETNLEDFYKTIERDDPIKTIVNAYSGMRIMKAPDLFEALAWAIIGQQINLQFAYNVKEQLVKNWGAKYKADGIDLYLFPTAEDILSIADNSFKEMQFSKQKVKYIKQVARFCIANPNTKTELCKMHIDEARSILTSIKGVGTWTANYVLMRCLHFKDALPIKDVALQRAVSELNGFVGKPSMQLAEELTSHWKDWQAYRTYYLWHHLSNTKKIKV